MSSGGWFKVSWGFRREFEQRGRRIYNEFPAPQWTVRWRYDVRIIQKRRGISFSTDVKKADLCPNRGQIFFYHYPKWLATDMAPRMWLKVKMAVREITKAPRGFFGWWKQKNRRWKKKFSKEKNKEKSRIQKGADDLEDNVWQRLPVTNQNRTRGISGIHKEPSDSQERYSVRPTHVEGYHIRTHRSGRSSVNPSVMQSATYAIGETSHNT